MTEPETWQETINGYVRPAVMIGMTTIFCLGFLIDKISAEAFIGAFGTVIAWFFKSRDEKTSADQATNQIKAIKETVDVLKAEPPKS